MPMVLTRPPVIFRLFNNKYLVTELNPARKEIWLTFDDGPEPEVTPEVLDILKQKEIKATFFLVGNNVVKHPEIYRMIIAQGHSVGNHTYNHMNGWKTPAREYTEDVFRCNEFFATTLFRPPYGRFTPSQYFLLRKSFRFILWSVLSGDFRKEITPGQCLKNLLNHTKSGSIVVFHDSLKAREKVLYALPRFIDVFRGKGFDFMTL
jgi:peptidoglycan/xylan/chitin deacetylase (PgdA/CDA1 family)